jgi:copper ion binding protein
MDKEHVILTVPEMSCSHCEDTIKKAVGKLNGVENVRVDLANKKVSIEYDDAKVSLNTIKETIEDQGYDVK